MAPDDLYPEMRRYPIDELTAERLLAGAVDPDDAPPGYAQVAALVQAAKAPPTAGEGSRRVADVSALTAALATAPAAAVTTPEGGRMFTARFGTKVLAIAIPAMALAASGAAAATGALPTPAQSAVHSGLANLGISVPSGSTTSDQSGTTGTDTTNTGNTGTSPTDTTNDANAVGPDVTGPAKYGLCRAYAANNGHMSPNSVAFKNLEKAAGGAAGVTSFCAGVTPGNATSGSAGTTTTTNSGTSSTQTGPSSSTPAGPPSWTPASGHSATSTPAGPPSSTPASGHSATSTPAGPPSSTPAGRP